VTAGVLFGKKIFPPEKIHYHAGFVVFQDDKKLDFSDNKFMNIKPCTKNEEEHEEDEQLEKAHLHDNVGDVIHVEQKNAKWKDLFTNIHFSIDYSKVTAYVNSKKVTDFENQEIHPYDSAVIFIGDNDKKYLKEAVTKKHIMEKETTSESCGS
jgi:pimeloyl-CoA synthetase